MNNLPKITVPKTITERVHDFLAIAILIATFVYLIWSWGDMPEQIPTHFNGRGEPDGWGSRGMLLLVPIISVIMYIMLSLLGKVPHAFNYPVKITENNAKEAYRLSLLMLSWMKLEMVLLFSYITWGTIRTALGDADGLGGWTIIVALGVIFGTLIYFVIRMMKLPKAA